MTRARLEIKTVRTDDFEMEYFTFGTGEKIFVILPGISIKSVMLSADSVAGAYRTFCEEYTVYVFDRKKDAKRGYTVREMARDTASAMRALGLSRVDLFGASQGGMIALCIAIDAPDLVRKMVVASTLARENETVDHSVGEWKRLAEAGDLCALNRSFFDLLYSDAFLKRYARALSMMEKEGTPEELGRFLVLADAGNGFDVYGELDQIRCPVLVLGAEEDRVLSSIGSREIAEKLGCEMYLYPEYGHAVYDEAPDFKERMLTFFRA